MNSSFFQNFSFSNTKALDELYEKYLKSPTQIDPGFQNLFESLDLVQEQEKNLRTELDGSVYKELKIVDLIDAYRTYGHLYANIDPIRIEPLSLPWQLEIGNFGFSEKDFQQLFPTCGLLDKETASLMEIIQCLREIYCNNIGIEYMGVQNPDFEKWLQKEIEPTRFKPNLSIEEKKMILQHLNKSELFESFLHTKYVGQKRFSLEGGETLIPVLAAAIEDGGELGIECFVIGMAHRGRLNVLSNILEKSYETIFSEFEDRWQPNTFEGSGDVKYHKGFTSTIQTTHEKSIQLILAPNPSHLEAVNAVVEGRVKGAQIASEDKEAKKKIAPILIHGDAAISGQGIVYETMQMYGLDGYSTGGTIHMIINNQIGFTTLPKDNRSTIYCTDIARAFNAPVFHVNAEDPEGCIYATHLAVAIRQKFQCDVFIDINCYRKYGHNETDEPAYTQPLEYQLIKNKKPIREIYRDNLIQQGVLEKELAESLEIEFKQSLQQALNSTKYPEKEAPQRPDLNEQKSKSNDSTKEMLRSVDTKVNKKVLIEVGEKICRVPENFNLHKKLLSLNEERLSMIHGKKGIDWGMGELLAYGTLLWEGSNVRLAGQDSGRGTFSHRHAMWMDQTIEKEYSPLKNLKEGQGRFDVYNSLLSEYAALGFEYGYSLSMPDSLVIWEAQFGDFANGAQVIIDQFIASAEQKWGQTNNIVLLLPHGYEGQGPEHSSARIERFLSLSNENNMFIVNPTTPAQLFHVLRRQIYRRSPKPLIIFTPKALLRYPLCVSQINEFITGSFNEIIEENESNIDAIEYMIFCSGKVYYDLIKERQERKVKNFVIIRIEQLYPLNVDEILKLIKKYENVKDYYWVQEEPENMGAWWYIGTHLPSLIQKNVTYIGREGSAASATGSIGRHKQEYDLFINQLFTVTGNES